MKYRKGKRTLHRLHYFGKWHTGVRDTGGKSRRKFQQLIDSGVLDLWAPLSLYSTPKVNTEGTVGHLGEFNFKEM